MADPIRPERVGVLLVEDDDGAAEQTLRWLRDNNYPVARASSSASGVAMSREGTFDVVVLDLQLPSEDGRADESTDHGLRALHDLVAQDPFRPIVVMTAHSMNRTLMREVLQRTRGGDFVFKDDENLERSLLDAVARASSAPAHVLGRSLREFRALVDKDDEHEEAYRRFIHAHWRAILGPEYREVRSPYEVSRGAKIDLYAVRHDGFPDLWELKLPRDKLFQRYNDWWHHSTDCAKALGQVMQYLELAERESSGGLGYDARKGLAVVANRPRGFVVIGRYGTDEERELRERLRLENRYYANITILTYDDLIERAKNFLQFLHEHRNGLPAPSR
ncbi:MAG: DUF4263 domain-containing protein [Myxococcales bacterium]|nr:DUF4263 domain-containing protein [Myxococcales bacterium]